MRPTQLTRCAILAVMMGGCIPVVPHGPRVEPGTRYSLMASVAHAPSLQDEQFTVAPSLYAGAIHGWAGEDIAGSLAVQLPVFALPFVLLTDEELSQFWRILMADAYVQPVREQPGGIEFGVGSMVSPGMVMPYVQFGTSGDGGIYTTQAMSFTFGSSFSPVMYWVPSVSIRAVRPDGRRIVDFFAQGLVGWRREDFGATQREWAIAIGALIEFVRPR